MKLGGEKNPTIKLMRTRDTQEVGNTEEVLNINEQSNAKTRLILVGNLRLLKMYVITDDNSQALSAEESL